MRKDVILAAVVVLLAAAVMLFARPGSAADRIRLKAEVRSHFGSAPTVLLGDSIAFEAAVPSLCGERVFNAAVPGNTIANLAADAPALVERLDPRTVVIAIGVNDAGRPNSDIEAWAKSYASLLDSFAGRSVVLVEINPVALDVTPITRLFDTSHIAAANAVIRDLAQERDLKVVPAPDRAVTRDGLHPSLAGRDLWRARLMEVACSDQT